MTDLALHVAADIAPIFGLDVEHCPRGEHEWMPFPGGYGCAKCPAWSFVRAPKEELVEKDPAGPINLSSIAESIRRTFRPEVVGAPVLPELPSLPKQPFDPTIYEQESTPTSEAIDRVTRICTEMLPVVREDVPLTVLLEVAKRIDAVTR